MRVTAAVCASVLVGVVADPASAAGSVYGTWTLAGSGTSWNGTLAVAATGFPQATWASNSTTPEISSGATAFLGPATPVGAVFGSSQNRPYLNLASTTGGDPSTTTFTFAAPTPAGGWGFAIGDVDADAVRISAIGVDGAPVAASAFGFQSGFNYCAVSPRPPGCTAAPFTSIPTWNPATATLTGTGTNTQGAAGWFRPAVPLRSLTFTISVLTGFPTEQYWFAALTCDISGTVSVEEGTPASPATLRLEHPDGTPVLDATGKPVTTTTDAAGAYSFSGVVCQDYVVAMQAPAEYVPVGPDRLPAAASAGDVTGLDFAITPSMSLPVTGPPFYGLTVAALALLATGWAVRRTARR